MGALSTRRREAMMAKLKNKKCGAARESAVVKDGKASIDRRITQLKLSGRKNRICASLWKSLSPAKRKQVDLLTDVGLYGLFDLFV